MKLVNDALLGLTLTLGLAGSAQAQLRWVAVSSELPGPTVTTASDLLKRVRRALTELGEMPVEVLEAPAATVPDTLRQNALTLSHEAMVNVAVGENRVAEALADHVEAIARTSLAEWNRDDMSARALFDACLFAVRGALSDGRIDAARHRLLRCRRQVPDLRPSPDVHPPLLLEFFEKEGLKRVSASLSVQGVVAGCAVRFQGRQASTTETRLVPGAYEVEIECSDRRGGRPQTVQLEAERPVSLEVDGIFERVRVGLRLLYRDDPERTALGVTHARKLAREAGAQRALLVSSDRDSKVQLSVIAVDSGAVLGQASSTLFSLESTIRGLVRPAPPAVVVVPPRSAAVPFTLGLAASSGMLFAAAGVTYALTSARAHKLAQSATYPYALQDRYARVRAWTFGLSATAALVGIGAVVPGFAQARLSGRAHRWLFVGSLAAGVLLAGAGTFALVRDERRPAPDVAPASEAALSAYLFSAAAPCFTWSVMALAR